MSALSRRDALRALGTATLAGAASTTGLTGLARATTPDGASGLTGNLYCSPSCVLTPTVTVGPYYFDANLVRRDITEGKTGVPMTLNITVVSAAACAVQQGALVDIWHADANGIYSGYSGQPGGVSTVGQTFLRGIQMTDNTGVATFTTVFPGWYSGRVAHIHFKIRTSSTTYVISQLFFDEALRLNVYRGYAPYNTRTNVDGDRTLSNDGVYSTGGTNASAMISSATLSGGAVTANLVVGISQTVTGSEAEAETMQAAMQPPFPNPCNTITTVRLSLPTNESRMYIAVYDLLGREVLKLHDGPLAAGLHGVEVDTRGLAVGAYIVHAESATLRLTQPLQVAR